MAWNGSRNLPWCLVLTSAKMAAIKLCHCINSPDFFFVILALFKEIVYILYVSKYVFLYIYRLYLLESRCKSQHMNLTCIAKGG